MPPPFLEYLVRKGESGQGHWGFKVIYRQLGTCIVPNKPANQNQ